jgi:hypothetical protein
MINYEILDEKMMDKQMDDKIIIDLSVFYREYNVTLEEMQEIVNFLLFTLRKSKLINSLMSYLKGSYLPGSNFIMDDFRKSKYFTIFINELLKESFVYTESRANEKEVKLEDYQVGHYIEYVDAFFETASSITRSKMAQIKTPKDEI